MDAAVRRDALTDAGGGTAELARSSARNEEFRLGWSSEAEKKAGPRRCMDVDTLLTNLESPDELARARALQQLCPCQS